MCDCFLPIHVCYGGVQTCVLIDTCSLNALPPRELASGGCNRGWTYGCVMLVSLLCTLHTSLLSMKGLGASALRSTATCEGHPVTCLSRVSDVGQLLLSLPVQCHSVPKPGVSRVVHTVVQHVRLSSMSLVGERLSSMSPHPRRGCLC
jgi:hypothetical protein